MMVNWVEEEAGWTTITYPYDGAEGIIRAIRECCTDFGSVILRAEWQPNVGTTVVYKKGSQKKHI